MQLLISMVCVEAQGWDVAASCAVLRSCSTVHETGEETLVHVAKRQIILTREAAWQICQDTELVRKNYSAC
jgi:hypothetical protein